MIVPKYLVPEYVLDSRPPPVLPGSVSSPLVDGCGLVALLSGTDPHQGVVGGVLS